MEVDVEGLSVEDFPFSMDTKGLCLLCLIKVEPDWEQSMLTSPYSAEPFQCLSRYLEVDLGRILNVRNAAKAKKTKIEEGGGFEGPQLKVNLCEGCTLMTEKFSELCQQLTECLKMIQKKLVDAEDAGLTQLLGKSEDEVKPRRGRKKKLETAEGLRNELMGKCSDKLTMLLPLRPHPRQHQHMTLRSVEPEPDDADPLHESLPTRESSKGIIAMGNNVKADVENDLIDDDDKYDDEDHCNDNNMDDDDEDWNQNSEFSDDSRQSPDLSSASSGSDNDDDDYDNEEEGDPDKNNSETIKSASSPSNRVKKPKQAKKPSLTPINPETGKHQCSICLKEFGSGKAAAIHYKSIHLKIRYECKVCGKDFGYKRTLRYHIRDKHSVINAPIKCCKCGETFSQKSDLKEHKQTSSCWAEIRAKRMVRTKFVSCDICEKTFNHLSRLKRHMDTVHLKLRNHVCDHCGKGFSNPDHLKRHVGSIHLNLREHVCAECGKGFNRPVQLTMHMKSIHLKEKEHVCDQCGKGYPFSNSLQKHIQQVHLRVRDYACDLCEEKFHSKHQLNSHRSRVHLGRKKRKRVYVSIKDKCLCNLCGKGFTRNNDLKRHVKSVHLQLREYACELCDDVTFKRKKSLDLHRRKFHSVTIASSEVPT